MRSASDLWGYRPFSVAIDKTVFLAVQCAYAQGDQPLGRITKPLDS